MARASQLDGRRCSACLDDVSGGEARIRSPLVDGEIPFCEECLGHLVDADSDGEGVKWRSTRAMSIQCTPRSR